MNRRQEDKLSMYYAVLAACDKHTAAWSGLTAFANGYTAFQGHVATIGDLAEAQQTGITGATRQKSVARQVMLALAHPIGRAVEAWAAVTGESQLAQRLANSRSAYDRLRDTEVETAARRVHTEAAARVAELADYGVTAALLTSLDTAITAYHTQVVAPRGAVTDRKAATAGMATAFDAADRILYDRLDKLIPMLALTQPAFATDYRNARIIVDSGGGRGNDEEEDESSMSSSFPSSVAA